MSSERTSDLSRSLWRPIDWAVGTYAVSSIGFMLWFAAHPGHEKCAEFGDMFAAFVAYGGGWGLGAIMLLAFGVGEMLNRRLSFFGLLAAVAICLALVIAPWLVVLVALIVHLYFGLVANTLIVVAIAVALLVMVWRKWASLLVNEDLHVPFLILVVFGATAAVGLLLQLGCRS